jgi:hypothetical protein
MKRQSDVAGATVLRGWLNRNRKGTAAPANVSLSGIACSNAALNSSRAAIIRDCQKKDGPWCPGVDRGQLKHHISFMYQTLLRQDGSL